MSKKNQVKWLPVLALFLLTSVDIGYSVDPVSLITEISENSVTITFYAVTTSSWDKTDALKKVLAEQATDYCKNIKACELQKTVTFQTSDVIVSDGYPQDGKSQNMLWQFYIQYPAAAKVNKNATVLDGAATFAIAKAARSKIYTMTEYSVVQVSSGDTSEDFLPAPNSQINAIMISVGVIVTILIGVLAIALHCWSKKLATVIPEQITKGPFYNGEKKIEAKRLKRDLARQKLNRRGSLTMGTRVAPQVGTNEDFGMAEWYTERAMNPKTRKQEVTTSKEDVKKSKKKVKKDKKEKKLSKKKDIQSNLDEEGEEMMEKSISMSTHHSVSLPPLAPTVVPADSRKKKKKKKEKEKKSKKREETKNMDVAYQNPTYTPDVHNGAPQNNFNEETNDNENKRTNLDNSGQVQGQINVREQSYVVSETDDTEDDNVGTMSNTYTHSTHF